MGAGSLDNPKLENPEDEIDASRAPLMEHLVELRARLIKIVLAFVLGAIACIPFLRQILDLLVWPFQTAILRYNARLAEQNLPGIDLNIIATHPLETFFVKLKLALFGGVILAFPVIAFQVYRFVAPGLYKNERGAFRLFCLFLARHWSFFTCFLMSWNLLWANNRGYRVAGRLIC